MAFRGSWNRNRGTGYKLVFVPFDEGRPLEYYEDFVRGFLLEPEVPATWGRPVGVLVMPEGSLLFTEEGNGWVYRVWYEGGPLRPSGRRVFGGEKATVTRQSVALIRQEDAAARAPCFHVDSRQPWRSARCLLHEG